MPTSSLSSSRLNRALHRLAEHAAAEHLVIELGLCHGRVIAVCRRRGGPLGARVHKLESVRCAAALAHIVADEEQLPDNWLNHDLKYYLAFLAARKRTDCDAFRPHPIISLAEPGHLLALKLRACQVSPAEATDLDDLGFLLIKMSLVSLEAVENVCKQSLPKECLGPDLRRIVAGLLMPIASDRCLR